MEPPSLFRQVCLTLTHSERNGGELFRQGTVGELRLSPQVSPPERVLLDTSLPPER